MLNMANKFLPHVHYPYYIVWNARITMNLLAIAATIYAYNTGPPGSQMADSTEIEQMSHHFCRM